MFQEKYLASFREGNFWRRKTTFMESLAKLINMDESGRGRLIGMFGPVNPHPIIVNSKINSFCYKNKLLRTARISNNRKIRSFFLPAFQQELSSLRSPDLSLKMFFSVRVWILHNVLVTQSFTFFHSLLWFDTTVPLNWEWK